MEAQHSWDVTVLGIFLEHARIRKASTGARCKSKDLEVEQRLDKEGFPILGTITRHKTTSGEEIEKGYLSLNKIQDWPFVLGIHKNFFQPALVCLVKLLLEVEQENWTALLHTVVLPKRSQKFSNNSSSLTDVFSNTVILLLWNTAITSAASMLYMVKNEGFTNVFDKSSSHRAVSAAWSTGKTSSCCHTSALLCPPPQV